MRGFLVVVVALLALPATADARLSDNDAWFEAGRVAVNWAWERNDDADATVGRCPTLSPNRRMCRVDVAMGRDRCFLKVVVARRRVVNGHVRSHRCSRPRLYIPPWGDGP